MQHVLVESDMRDAETIELPGGTAAILSQRMPGSEDRVNEDAAGVLSFESGVVILAIADGVGGHVGGEDASRAAIESLVEVLPDDLAVDDAELRTLVMNGIEQANTRILERGNGSATTLTVLTIQNRWVRAYQVGDSKAIISGQRGKLRYETIAHSPVGYAVESGLLEAHDAIRHDDLHVVSNIVGSSEMRIDVGPRIQLQVRDTILVGSDGLFDNVLITEAIDSIRRGSIEQSARRLATLCRTRMAAHDAEHPSKPDDLSFIIYRPAASAD